jgi:modification methylase
MAHRFPTLRPGTHLEASVWPTGQQDALAQITQGPYVPETAQDSRRMPPAIAAYAIAAYTRPGDTVLDPDCGAGTVVVEALRAGCHAVGVVRQSRWWPIARVNAAAAPDDRAALNGMVIEESSEDAGQLVKTLGPVRLLLTTWRGPKPPRHESPSVAPNGHPGADAQTARTIGLQALLIQYRQLLHPDGHVIVVVPRQHEHGYLLDTPVHVVDAGCAAGLVPVERCVALSAELRGDRLLVRAPRAQRRAAARRERRLGKPVMAPAHHDVLIFHVPRPPRARVEARPMLGHDGGRECAAVPAVGVESAAVSGGRRVA